MASSPDLAIAKATLSATLFRADPTSLPRPEVDAFFPLLSTTTAKCSRPHVQKCKAWIVANIAPSGARSAALGKFLVAFSKSLAADAAAAAGGTVVTAGNEARQRPSTKRRRLHVLYILNDVLHHEVVRRGNATFGGIWDAALPLLFAHAAAFDNCPKHVKKLEALLALWEERRYLATPAIAQCRDALARGPAAAHPTVDEQPGAPQASLKLARDAPFVLPSMHGDPASPWYDLPAATWLPHLTPNSTKPMAPDLIRPIRLAQGPADAKLADAVRNLLADVERMFSKEGRTDDDPHADISELGERIVIDEITGDIIGGETYYGWSRQFCERMKERRKKSAAKDASRGRSSLRSRSGSVSRSRSRSRSRSYSRSRSRSYSPPSFKRQRISSRSRIRHRSPTASRSRSRSPSRKRNGSRKRGRSRSRSRSRSQSPRRDRRRNDDSYSRSRSLSPDRRYGNGDAKRPRSTSQSRPSPHPAAHHIPAPTPPPPSHIPPPSLPFPPVPVLPHAGGFPIPPPPPIGFQGHWPPAPPPLPPSMVGAGPQAWAANPALALQMMAGWGAPQQAPPPPPPPPGPPYPHPHGQVHHHQGHFGRGGGGGFRGRGRGGYRGR